jgi:ferredoxin
MKIYVDMDKCQHYGQCTFEAPTVFALNDDGKLEYVGDVGDALADQVEAAADVCPMQAIEISA